MKKKQKTFSLNDEGMTLQEIFDWAKKNKINPQNTKLRFASWVELYGETYNVKPYLIELEDGWNPW